MNEQTEQDLLTLSDTPKQIVKVKKEGNVIVNNITLKSSKSIFVDEIQEIVNEFPEKFSNLNSKENWGWRTIVDIYLPEWKEITLSGSLDSIKNVAEFLKEQLEENDHKISIGKVW